MVRSVIMWSLVVYRLILMCTRYASGCHIGQPQNVRAVRVDIHLPVERANMLGVPPTSFVDGHCAMRLANMLGVPPTSFVDGHCAMRLANQTSTSHCLTGVLVTIASPTDCANSAEFMVPHSGFVACEPIADDGVCGALFFPKLTSTVHGTAGLLGNAICAILTRIWQVLHAIVGRAPCLIVFVQGAWSLGVGHFVRFVSDACRSLATNTCK